MATAAELPARGVCGAANNIFADLEVARSLHARSVLVVPDFVANAGALIQGALWHLSQQHVGPERIRHIAKTTGEVLDRALAENVAPIELALRMARERVDRAPARS
jgi:glutamate dehydrogenase/leucine dehydrogenase